MERRFKKQKSQDGKGDSGHRAMWPYYLLFFILLAAYAVFNNALIGAALFILLVALIVLEFSGSIGEEGFIKSIYEIIVSVGAALMIWFVLSLLLNTKYPLDAVASCSMLPTLGRGDVVLLQGISNFSSFVSGNKVPVVNMTSQQFSYLQENMGKEFLAFFFYPRNWSGNISEYSNSPSFKYMESRNYAIGLFSISCIDSLRTNDYRACFVGNQDSNPIKYNYSIGNLSVNNVRNSGIAVFTSSIRILNTTINENRSMPIVVYRASPNDSFSGDIIHRLVAAINVNGTYYFLTKGDNNPALDIEFANYPPSQEDIVGHVLGSFPILGYIKLILSGQLSPVQGCNMVLSP